MRARGICTVVVLILLGLSRPAASEPINPCTASAPCHLRMRESTTLTKDDGSAFRLPPGHFYDDGTWVAVDDEFKRLQTQETRLTAENKSLRGSMESWKPGWFTLLVATTVGIAGGFGGYYWYEHR